MFCSPVKLKRSVMEEPQQHILDAIEELPPIPVVAIKALEILQSEEGDARQLAEAISLDPVVSARILSIANSPIYGLQRQVSRMQDAVVVLGEKTLRSLILAASMRGLHKSFGLLEKMLWETAIGRALACRHLSAHLSLGDKEEAFLAGLFSNIGMIVRNNNQPELFQQVLEEAYNTGYSYLALEPGYFDYSYCDVGAAVLEHWNFAPVIIDAVRYHGHLQFAADTVGEVQQLAALVNCADSLCRYYGIGQREAETELDVALCQGARKLQLSVVDLEEPVAQFGDIFTASRDYFMA